MQPLRGSFSVLVLYDVAEQIELDKLREIQGSELSELSKDPPGRKPSFKHPAPEYVRFDQPPVVEYLDPVSITPGERFTVRILLKTITVLL